MAKTEETMHMVKLVTARSNVQCGRVVLPRKDTRTAIAMLEAAIRVFEAST